METDLGILVFLVFGRWSLVFGFPHIVMLNLFQHLSIYHKILKQVQNDVLLGFGRWSLVFGFPHIVMLNLFQHLSIYREILKRVQNDAIFHLPKIHYLCTMKVDYIVVGLGLAGLCFIEELKKANKSFVVFENSSQKSSKVAAGMFNPVVLKRFTPVWNGKEQLDYALPFFKKLESQFNKKYIHDIAIYRVFKSVEEQNNWYAASDKPIMSHYITTPILSNDNKHIIAPFGFGKLTNTGKVDVNSLLLDYKTDLKSKNVLLEQTFEYQLLKNEETLNYKDIIAERIVFCEGYGLKGNPFFKELPMNEAKGELLTIHAPELKINFLLKAAVFVLPLGDDLYKVGATFNWKDKTQQPTKAGEMELLMKLDMTIDSPYTIVAHEAGIRPTIKDRRPLVGTFQENKNIAILNGLGTRGVMIGPTMAQQLFNHLEFDLPLDKEVDIRRFF